VSDTPDVFTTKVVQLFCTLYGRDHRVVENGILKDSDGTVWFSFDAKAVNDDVKAYRQGKPLKVNLHKSLWAYGLFRCILHGSRRDLSTVVALRTMGHEVVDDGIWRDNGKVMYEFDKSSDADRDKFWEGQDIEVKHTDLWGAMGWFRSNIHSV